MKRIVCQGDSITDAGRFRENLYSLGEGYPQLVAAKLSFKCPGKFEFINKGVSGDKSTQLYVRCKEEIINLAPDYLSILIGVNDIWHELAVGGGVSVKRYSQLLSMLIEDVQEALPETKIALLEPFVLKGPATEGQWATTGCTTIMLCQEKSPTNTALSLSSFSRSLTRLIKKPRPAGLQTVFTPRPRVTSL